MTWHLDRAGMEFTASWEGLRLKMYDDGGPGIGNATIGIGHLIHAGPIDGRLSEAPFKDGITRDVAFQIFESDSMRFQDLVNRLATVELTQNQGNALFDFSFNTGGGYPEVWRAVNAGQDPKVLLTTAILPAWATTALKRRRLAEYNLYNTPDTPCEEPVEEDEMPTIRVWCPERGKTYLIAGTSAVPIDNPVDDKEFEKLYGPHAAVLTGAQLDAMLAK